MNICKKISKLSKLSVLILVPLKKIYQYEDHIIQINANNLILFNPENNKSICFSTFYNLRQLKGDNKIFFNETLIKCFAGHYNDSLVSQEWGFY